MRFEPKVRKRRDASQNPFPFDRLGRLDKKDGPGPNSKAYVVGSDVQDMSLLIHSL